MQRKELLNPHEIAAEIAKRQNSGNDARCLIAPDEHPFVPATLPVPKKKIRKPINHQAKYRKALIDIQLRNEQALAEQHEKAEREKCKMERIRQKCIGPVESKVFATKHASVSITTNSTASASLESSTSSASIGAVAPLPKDIRRQMGFDKHKSFGHVPKYILERKAIMAEAEQERTMITEPEVVEIFQPLGMAKMRESERQSKLKELKESENQIKSELAKLPFALHSSGSMNKRGRLEQRLNEIVESRALLSKKVLSRRR